jgi:lipoprotein-releasing system ATP-binding protein
MPSNAPLLQLRDVSREFPAASDSGTLAVLNAISLDVGAGESLAIVGPSGSGKSTLLQIIGTLDRPSSGQVLLEGVDVAKLDAQAVAEVRNRMIGFVFQAHYLLPQCTVLENVLVPTLAGHASGRMRQGRSAAGLSRSTSNVNERVETLGRRADTGPAAAAASRAPFISTSTVAVEQPEQRASRLLDRVGLGARLEHFPRQLSGGESQRVAVVRALINSPRLLLADEPTGSLDHAAALSLTQLLVEINKEEDVTLIVVTHSLELANLMRRILELQY